MDTIQNAFKATSVLTDSNIVLVTHLLNLLTYLFTYLKSVAYHGTTEHRSIFSQYLSWRIIFGATKHHYKGQARIEQSIMQMNINIGNVNRKNNV